MEKVNIIKLDKALAFDYAAKVLEVTLSEIEDEGRFFSTLEEVFECVYMDENDRWNDLLNTINLLKRVQASDILESGCNTVAEHLALNWDDLLVTPYGYVSYIG